MSNRILRREFLKAASLAAGALRVAVDSQGRRATPGNEKIGSAHYNAVADYPILPKRYSAVTLTDTFWKPKVQTNADVTIPFEVQKAGGDGGARGLNGGVLEAAI